MPKPYFSKTAINKLWFTESNAFSNQLLINNPLCFLHKQVFIKVKYVGPNFMNINNFMLFRDDCFNRVLCGTVLL